MNKRRALITTATDVPVHLKTWTTVGLDEHDLIIVVGEDESPHDEINKFLDSLVEPGGVRSLYLQPEDQTRWEVAKLLQHGDITQRLNIALLEALDWGAKTITVVGEGVYPLTTDFYERTESALRGAAPHWLVSSKSGWWNPGTLLDPPVTLRGFPISQRNILPDLVRELELEHALRPAVVVHQMLGDPDVDAIEQITTQPEAKRFRSDTNVLMASGTWCPFTFRGAVTFTREITPLLFVWPYVGRYGDVWHSLLAQRAMQDLGRHVVFGFPLVRRDARDSDPLTKLSDELVGMRRTDQVVKTLRHVHLASELNSYGAFLQLTNELTSKNLLLSGEIGNAFVNWQTDLNRLDIR